MGVDRYRNSMGWGWHWFRSKKYAHNCFDNLNRCELGRVLQDVFSDSESHLLKTVGVFVARKTEVVELVGINVKRLTLYASCVNCC